VEAGKFSSLKSLEILNGHINANAAIILSKIQAPKLTRLVLGVNYFGDEGFSAIIKLILPGQLKELKITSSNLTKVSMETLKQTDLTSLEILSLSKLSNYSDDNRI
jgi:hypothetical protein